MTIRPLSPALEEKARVELNENAKRIESDLQYIKEWLDKQPHLRARRDDQWLIAFLRGCKYSLERTKEKLDLYYSLRSLAPELYRVKYNDKLFKEIMDLKVQIILPKLQTPDAPRVAIVRPGKYDPNKLKVTDIFSATNIIQQFCSNVNGWGASVLTGGVLSGETVDDDETSGILLVDDDAVVVNGLRTVVDLEGVNMGHLLQMTPAVIKKMVVMGQDATPLRVKGTHYLNTPNGFETVFNTINLFLNEKNKNRLYVHNKNYEELYKYIPKEVLPEEYGGNGGTSDEIVDYWMKKVEEYKSWLDEEVKYGSDEQKRPGQPNTAETLFGLEGSFRKLDFD